MASEKLGRLVTLGALDFKPWSLEVVLLDLASAKSAATAGTAGNTALPATPQLGIKRSHINAELQSLLRLAPVSNGLAATSSADRASASLSTGSGGEAPAPPVSASFAPATTSALTSASTNAPATSANTASASAASQLKPARAQKTAASLWKVQLANVAVRGGRIHWLDETLASPAQVRLADFTFHASEIALPFAASAPLKFNASLGLDSNVLIDSAKSALSAQKSSVKPAAKASARATASKLPSAQSPNASARLALNGIATDQSAQVSIAVADWPLAMVKKYIGQFLLPALKGQLDAQLAVSCKAANSVKAAHAERSSAQALVISAPQVSLRDVQLAQGKVCWYPSNRSQWAALTSAWPRKPQAPAACS